MFSGSRMSSSVTSWSQPAHCRIQLTRLARAAASSSRYCCNQSATTLSVRVPEPNRSARPRQLISTQAEHKLWGILPNRPVPCSAASMRTVFFGLVGRLFEAWIDRAVCAGCVPLNLGFLDEGFFARLVCDDFFLERGAGWSSSLSLSGSSSLISSSVAGAPFSTSSSSSSSSLSSSSSVLLRFVLAD